MLNRLQCVRTADAGLAGRHGCLLHPVLNMPCVHALQGRDGFMMLERLHIIMCIEIRVTGLSRIEHTGPCMGHVKIIL